jgi:hypothetical protein
MMKRISLLMITCNALLIYSASQEEKDALTIVGWSKAHNFKDVALAAYPKVADDDKEDAWDLILKIKGVTNDDKPKHKSELKTDADIKAETCRVLKKHKQLVESAGANIAGCR